MRTASIVLLAAALTTTPAFAIEGTDAFEKSNLAGKWAYDCAKPASNANYADTWKLTDGKVTLTTRGEKETVTEPSRFGVSADGKVYYDTKGMGVLMIELLVEPTRYRVWSSEDVVAFLGGEVYIKDGKFDAGKGADTPWYNKCTK